jgi:hypothetical protein
MLFFGYYASHTNPQPDRRDTMAATIPHRHVDAVEGLRIRALQRVPVLSVEDQAVKIIESWKAYRKPGLAYFFHLWADHAPIDTPSDRRHKRDVRAALEAEGFTFGD